MSKVNVGQVPIADIDSNPHRRIGNYPYNEKKIETLQRSIDDVGLWEGVIGRRVDNRIQIAFGHHRIEAAKRAGLKKVSIIIRDLDDDQMLQFMGRENMEDFNADFLVMLETWEAGVERFISRDTKYKIVDVARFLGWTFPSGQTNNTVDACAAALPLINDGYLDREDFKDVSTRSALELAKATKDEIARSERMEEGGVIKDASKRKDAVVVSTKKAAQKVRDGELGYRDVRTAVSGHAFVQHTTPPRPLPEMDRFMEKLIGQLCDILVDDTARKNLDALLDAINNPDIEWDDKDRKLLGLVSDSLGSIAKRAKEYQADMKIKPQTVKKPEQPLLKEVS